MDKSEPATPVAEEVRSQLSGVGAVRGVIKSQLGPSGETVLMYDTQDSSEPNPEVAVMVDSKLVRRFDLSALVEYGQGGIYAASCEFELAPHEKGLAIAYVLNGDGTGSAFLVLTWFGGAYQMVFHRTVGQGRMVFKSDAMELWERTMGKYAARPESAKFECEWCRHRYQITEFEWRDGKFVEVKSKRTKKAYDPARISGNPLLIEQHKWPKEKPGF